MVPARPPPPTSLGGPPRGDQHQGALRLSNDRNDQLKLEILRVEMVIYHHKYKNTLLLLSLEQNDIVKVSNVSAESRDHSEIEY